MLDTLLTLAPFLITPSSPAPAPAPAGPAAAAAAGLWIGMAEETPPPPPSSRGLLELAAAAAAGEAAAGDGRGLGPRRGLLRDVVQREHLRRAVLGPRMRTPGLLLAGGGGVTTEAQLPPRVRARAATCRALPCTTGGR